MPLLLACLALLLALAGWLAGYQAWQQLRAAQAAARGAQQADASALAERLDGGLRSGEQRVAALQQELNQGLARQQAELARQQQALEESYQALQRQLGQDSSGWVVAEAEYLMRSANHRLQLAQDVPGAIAALEAADQRLRSLADPALLPVREQLADGIAALKAVPQVDVEGLALTLVSLARRAETLPVLGARYTAPDAAGGTAVLDAARQAEGWQAAVDAVWNEVKGLVEVRRNDIPAKPLLAPEHEYFLHLNLRLQLDAARLALLRRAEPLYAASLATAREWVATWFDQEPAPTRALLAELERLEGTAIAPALPDISGALHALRALPARQATPATESAPGKAP
ncbi:MAG TPA: uroporphyrinogen-III C-methyltransferase [Gammaproteobacteria bacterium]